MRGLAVAPGEDLLERQTELTRLAELIKAASERQGRLVVIEGPAGIGKTSLLAFACVAAQRAGLLVLRATGGELERDFPQGIVRQFFEGHLRGRSPQDRSVLLGGAARLAAAVVAPDVETARADDATDASFAVAHGLYWLTANLAEEAPLLLAVDDAQWADAPSRRFLAHLARRLEGMPVLVVICIRTGETHASEGLLAELDPGSSATVLQLAPLSENAVQRLVASTFNEPPHPDFTAACHAATGGIPFLARELLSTLRERGTRPDREAAPEVAAIAPQTVARATLRRLAKLGDGAIALARAVAVLGADGRLDRAARLASTNMDEAVMAADDLIAMGILRPGSPVEFIHPIVRGAIYQDIPPAARAAAHGRAAELLVGDGADVDAVAAHLLLTQPRGRVETVQRLREAAVRASARGAPESAETYLRRAAEEGGVTREDRVELLCRLGSATRVIRLSGAAAPFEEAYGLAESPIARARVAHDLAEALMWAGQPDRASAIIAGAIDDVEDIDRDLAVRLEALRAGQAFHDARLQGEFFGRLPRLREIVMHGGREARGMALLLAGVGGWLGTASEDIHELLRRGLDGGSFLADHGSDSWALPHAFSALVLTDELAAALRLAEDALDDARRRGSHTGNYMTLAYRAWAHSRGGDLVSAEADLREALDPISEHHPAYVPTALWFCIDALLERPQLADLLGTAETLAVDPAAEPRPELTTLPLTLRGRLRLAKGDMGRAVQDLTLAGQTVYAGGNPIGWGWRPALAQALATSDRRRALELGHLEVDIARGVGSPRGIGVALRTVGLIQGGEEGIRRLREAVDILASTPARLEHARALVELGAAQRRANQRSAARDPLRVGLDLAHRCGANRLEERARAELVASGARPRRVMLTGRDALTATEQRIAGMAADGMSNPEIAQALFVTRRTVENHLARVYAKLEIHSRGELPVALSAVRRDGEPPRAASIVSETAGAPE